MKIENMFAPQSIHIFLVYETIRTNTLYIEHSYIYTPGKYFGQQ